MILVPPTYLFPDEFVGLPLDDEQIMYFLSVIPLYREEMDFKLKHGAEALLERLGEVGVSEILDIHRPNECG